MIHFTDTQLYAWIAGLVWPLSRILGLISSAPVFGQANVPLLSKLGLGIVLTLLLAPVLPPMPAIDPSSPAGLLILAQQVMIGLSLGFIMNLVFMAIDIAGSLAGLTMGLGFASFFDPQTEGQTNAVNQLLALLATLVFLQLNGHLVLISVLADSFRHLPVGQWPDRSVVWQILEWSKLLFSAGIQLALPVVTALLITNVALGILTRAAPQLNLFGIGFPVTISIGFITLLLSLQLMLHPMEVLFDKALQLLSSLTAHTVDIR
ncbi:MAG: flagellar biosynthetic protein FliR [Betaproteobacteria bacterium]|nr:flagellar biosynthetic protein FliR [Betaproteobacteria bacterium]